MTATDSRRGRGGRLGVGLAALFLSAVAATASAEAPAWTGALGDSAPALVLTALDGETVDLSALGPRAVLVNLWATYCLPCRHEMPLLDALAEEHADDLVILGVSLDGPRAEPAVRELADELEISYPVVLDPEGRASRLFEAPALPASYLFDRSGRLVWKRLGVIVENDPDFAKGLETALQAESGAPAEGLDGEAAGGSGPRAAAARP